MGVEKISIVTLYIIYERNELEQSAVTKRRRVYAGPPGAVSGYRKPCVSRAAALKIEGRMLGKCDDGWDTVTAPGSLSKGNGSLL